MAGFVRIYDEGPKGVANVGSRVLTQLFKFLIWCKSVSPILAADHEFDPQLDFEGLGGATNYLNLAEISNGTVAEIGRLLVAASDPSYSYWSDNSKLFDKSWIEREYSQGHDVNSACLQFKTSAQAAFRQVAELIRQRLKLT